MANIKRFNLQFNLDKEEEALAANILENMGRKKAALVARAIVKLLNNDTKEIDDIKVYDFNKTSDLLFRGTIMSGIQADVTEKVKKPIRKEPAKKINASSTLQKNKVDNDNKSVKNDVSEVKEPEESTEALSDMLDFIGSFMEH